METKLLFLQTILTIIVGAAIYTYLYPWLYNQINHYTKRSEDLNDEIDFINSILMVTLFFLFVMVIGSLAIISILAIVPKLKIKNLI